MISFTLRLLYSKTKNNGIHRTGGCIVLQVQSRHDGEQNKVYAWRQSNPGN